jgi:hypothetical protein
MGLALYVVVRLLLWSSGVAIALFPTLQAIHLMPHGHLASSLDAINKAGHFRDLFFVIVPASVVSLSTTLDFLCSRPRGEITGLMLVIALILNVVVLLSGFLGFILIPPGAGELDPDEFSLYSWPLMVGLLLSLVTELWIAGAAHVERHEEPLVALNID